MWLDQKTRDQLDLVAPTTQSVDAVDTVWTPRYETIWGRAVTTTSALSSLAGVGLLCMGIQFANTTVVGCAVAYAGIILVLNLCIGIAAAIALESPVKKHVQQYLDEQHPRPRLGGSAQPTQSPQYEITRTVESDQTVSLAYHIWAYDTNKGEWTRPQANVMSKQFGVDELDEAAEYEELLTAEVTKAIKTMDGKQLLHQWVNRRIQTTGNVHTLESVDQRQLDMSTPA